MIDYLKERLDDLKQHLTRLQSFWAGTAAGGSMVGLAALGIIPLTEHGFFLDLKASGYVVAHARGGQERDGYGLYTYVLFRNFDEKLDLFYADLSKLISPARDQVDRKKFERSQLHLFVVPYEREVKDNKKLTCPGVVRAEDSDFQYDRPYARLLIDAFCAEENRDKDICRNKHLSGPFLLTYATRSIAARIGDPVFYLDLSQRSPNEYAEYIIEYSTFVRRKESAGQETMSSFALGIMNFLSRVETVATQSFHAIAKVNKALAGEPQSLKESAAPAPIAGCT
jgi:hypothetical protein